MPIRGYAHIFIICEKNGFTESRITVQNDITQYFIFGMYKSR
nr:MAG TPA: hypothetical protein [Caudoviricetes sp.]